MNHRPLSFLLMLAGSLVYAESLPRDVHVEIGSHPIRSFDPRLAMGGSIDGHWQGETAAMFTPGSVRKMLEAGLGPVSVRLRTELAVEAWHWNSKGSWSDPAHGQGYWTSDALPDPLHPIDVSYGYKLPRRGDTLDEANNDGYSRLVDGDPKSFWKSNPYLTHAYNGEPDNRHPQWVVLDFGKPVPINAMRIQWAEPYATDFRVEYASGGRVYFGGHPWNVWHEFSQGTVQGGKGGKQFLKFGKAVRVRYLRIWMTRGSGTANKGCADPRDAMGYAIREISAGYADQFSFDDRMIHAPDKNQTLCYVSSTDPWHRECDRDPRVEQPGIDCIFRSGITRGLPIMLPVPVFYDTPENGAALAGYIRRSRYSVGKWELGEEPDGQRVDPRDFGALYALSSRLIRNAHPKAVMGGPSFVTADVQPNDDTYRFDKRWWIRDFLGELKHRGQTRDLRFLSFEWYLFDDVEGDETRQLPQARGMLEQAMKRLSGFGLPLVIGELNCSVFPCRQEVDLAGALLNAETDAQFLCGGGDAAFFYSYEPNKLEQTGGSWGNQIMLQKGGNSPLPLATFHTLQLLTREWMDPNGGSHGVLPVSTGGSTRAESDLLSLFPLKRPDGGRSLLVINKDATHPVRLSVKGLLKEPCTLITYSCAQYIWQAEGNRGHPSRNLPPARISVPSDLPITIPPWSLAVLK
jgi:hypothetical protein